MSQLSASHRLDALTAWVASQLQTDNLELHPIASDAGFRRYFRFAQPSQWLAVDAPPATEDSRQFIALADYLSEQGLSTPRILAADETQGFLLVEDFGDQLLYSRVNAGNADQHYHQAFAALLKLATCPDNATLIPRYDQALLRRELQIFSEWFVEKLLGYPLKPDETAQLENLFHHLETTALSQPQTLVHRDFHSRNLIIRDAGNDLGIIDFQGALWGACTYDLVSLLRDCYLRWPAGKVQQWALDYCSLAKAGGLLPDSLSDTEFLRWFDEVGLQRHIKVLGIFARLYLRDNKPHYLDDLPLVIRYTLEVAEAHPELRPFADWFKAKLLPLAERQPWYRHYAQAGEPEVQKGQASVEPGGAP